MMDIMEKIWDYLRQMDVDDNINAWCSLGRQKIGMS
jgi:hypothetical protein